MQQQQPMLLRVLPLQSCVDIAFWQDLGHLKLDSCRLAEDAIQIQGFCQASRHTEISAHVLVDATSLHKTHELKQGWHSEPGTLYVFNTYENFRNVDRAALLHKEAASLWHDIQSGAAEENPERLNRFLLLTYGDLKLFRFSYWFAFPAIKPPSPFQLVNAATVAEAFDEDLSCKVATACDVWRGLGLESDIKSIVPYWLLHVSTDASEHIGVLPVPLAEYEKLREMHNIMHGDVSASSILLAFADPSNLPDYPGWPLRNLLLMVAQRWRLPHVRVICVRDTGARMDVTRSLLLDVRLPDIPQDWSPGPQAAVGWELDSHGKMAHRSVDVSPMLDPAQLAQQAVDLNLRLMRWRAAPDLNLPVLARTKCLLLGAGTLGCAVARTLLGWGMTHITLVDNGSVSFSNPVRQSLYEYQDCLEGGQPKAAAAAARMRAVYPSVDAHGLQLAIPMPGHPPATEAQEESMRQSAADLAALVESHDAVFLLTDTRESRWLPSLLAAAADKIVITAAVGFDSFVVMRHGGAPTAAADQQQDTPVSQLQRRTDSDVAPPPHMLGCYFCNDVVAPVNSTLDRSADQQCTVARPGLAPVAGALAVELLASLLQHPDGVRAPAPSPGGSSTSGRSPATALGDVPHMVRGQLSSFSQTCMVGQAYSQCTACSAAVVHEYRQRGWEFLIQAIRQPRMLEQLTGLAELHAASDLLADLEVADTGSRGAEPTTADMEAIDDGWAEL